MYEVTDPFLSVLGEGHQWYWSYEYPDFLKSGWNSVKFGDITGYVNITYYLGISDLKHCSSSNQGGTSYQG